MSDEKTDKPRVLILGGLGFIGRNLVTHLVSEDAASKIRVVDKAMPQTSFLAPVHAKAFDSPLVEYMQGNLVSAATLTKVFAPEEGAAKFDYVINLAAETRFGLEEAVYQDKCVRLSKSAAQEAAKHQPKMYIEVSTAQVYSPDGKPSNEDAKVKPFTVQAECKLESEKAVTEVDGLNRVIVRPAIVYGVGDVMGLNPRLVCGAVYVKLGEKMKFLWSEKLKLNTVHVLDVCRALMFLCENGESGHTYNLADKSDTDQGLINKHLEAIFGIKTGFQGSLMSTVAAKYSMTGLAAQVNDKHMGPWMEMCREAGIINTPLSPYLDKELLANNPQRVDGSKIEKLGFTYSHPEMTSELLSEQVHTYIRQGLFPNVLKLEMPAKEEAAPAPVSAPDTPTTTTTPSATEVTANTGSDGDTGEGAKEEAKGLEEEKKD